MKFAHCWHHIPGYTINRINNLAQTSPVALVSSKRDWRWRNLCISRVFSSRRCVAVLCWLWITPKRCRLRERRFTFFTGTAHFEYYQDKLWNRNPLIFSRKFEINEAQTFNRSTLISIKCSCDVGFHSILLGLKDETAHARGYTRQSSACSVAHFRCEISNYILFIQLYS